MQVVRVYTGTDGESHFEDLTPEQLATIVNNLGGGTSPWPAVLRHPSRTITRPPGVSMSSIWQAWRNLRRLTGPRDGSPPATCSWPKT